MKEAILFIDGNNLYHNLRNMRIKPSSIDFKRLVDFISKSLNLLISEVKYYNSMPTLKDGKKLYYSHLKFIDNLKNMPRFNIYTRKLQVHSTKELLKEKQELIDSMELCRLCKPIVEENILDAIGNKKKKEKGIDVMMSVDMVECAIKNQTNYLIVFSGDADFIPAMKLAEKKNEKVLSISLAKGYSKELRENYKYFILGRNKILENCLK